MHSTHHRGAAAPGSPTNSEFADYAPRITFDGTPLDDFMKDGGKQNDQGHWEKALGNGITLIRRI